MGDSMMLMALPMAIALVALLAVLGLAAVLYGADSRDSFLDDRR